MIHQVLVPPVPPSPGTESQPEIKLRVAEFGDGYQQATRDGINHIRERANLRWEKLTDDQATELYAYFKTMGGDQPFFYKLTGDASATFWTCAEWSKSRSTPRTVSANLKETFQPTTGLAFANSFLGWRDYFRGVGVQTEAFVMDFVRGHYFVKGQGGSTSLSDFLSALGGAYARASAGNYFTSAGNLVSAGNDVPRFDYDPVGLTFNGLLMEGARTNSLRNNTMQGAVVGAFGTLPTNWSGTTSANSINRSVIGTGTENGIDYIDVRFLGTSSGSGSLLVVFESSIQIVAASGQTWTASAYCKLAGGSMTGVSQVALSINGANGGSTLEASVTPFTPNVGPLRAQRQRVVRTLSNGATTRIFSLLQLSFNAASAIDITLRIGLPQLEQGASASSPIKTSTVAVSRAADNMQLPTATFLGAANTMLSEVILGEASSVFWQIHTGSDANNIRLAQSSGVLQGTIVTASAGQAGFGANFVVGLPTKVGYAWATNDIAYVADGGDVTTDTLAALAPAYTTLQLGNNNIVGASNANGHLRRLVMWSYRVPNAILKSLSALSL